MHHLLGCLRLEHTSTAMGKSFLELLLNDSTQTCGYGIRANLVWTRVYIPNKSVEK